MSRKWRERRVQAHNRKRGRERESSNGVVWSGQALDKYKQRKREEIPGFIFKAKEFESEM